MVEHGVLAQVENNVFEMVEADHMVNGLPNPTFVGIIGHGWFELIDHKSAKLVQLGHLVDGSASGFMTLLEKAGALPEVPVEQTWTILYSSVRMYVSSPSSKTMASVVKRSFSVGRRMPS